MSARPIAFGRSRDATTEIEWPMDNADDVVIATTHEDAPPHLRIFIRAQIKDQNKATHFIMDIKYLDSQIRNKKTHTFPLIIYMRMG